MNKLKLQPEDLLVDSFQTILAERPKGTVFGEQCTCYTQCTCPGCPTCDASCNGCPNTCQDYGTCCYSCAATCYGSCPPETCYQTCQAEGSCYMAAC